jgi:Nif-specific regulatory protein
MAEPVKPSVLHSVADMLPRPVTTGELLKAIIDRVVEELQAERGTLYLVDAITGELCSRVAHLPEITEIRLPPGQGVAGHVAETGVPALLDDASRDPRFFPGVDQMTGYVTRSMLAVPVRDGDGAIRGVLQVLNARHGTFTAADRDTLQVLADQVAEALTKTSLRPRGDRSRGVLIDGPFNHIVGEAPLMAALYERILAAAGTDATVLIRGETGTGKTLVARAIHDNSERRLGPLVHVDCATLPASLIESELLGHERGAFTGADRRIPGKFEQAAGGTLFLDEIGELPLPLQGKLLRFLQDREFERLGGRETLHVDARVVSATNVDLEAQVAAGAFRRDLYYRIRVLELTIPSLRERGPTDIERLAEHFLDVYTHRHRRKVRRLSAAALARLCAQEWPGNVRELEHCIESAVVVAPGDTIEPEHLALPGPPARSTGGTIPPGTPLAEVERLHIQRTLEACGGNRTEAARQLGIGRNTLVRKLREP